MAKKRTYVCVALSLLCLSAVMIVLAEERNDQGNQNSSAPFQTKQVFSGTFTIPIDAPAMKLASLDLSAYSKIRLEETVQEISIPGGISPSFGVGATVSIQRSACPLPFTAYSLGCSIGAVVTSVSADPGSTTLFSSGTVELVGTSLDLMAVAYTGHAVGGTAKILVTIFGRP